MAGRESGKSFFLDFVFLYRKDIGKRGKKCRNMTKIYLVCIYKPTRPVNRKQDYFEGGLTFATVTMCLVPYEYKMDCSKKAAASDVRFKREREEGIVQRLLFLWSIIGSTVGNTILVFQRLTGKSYLRCESYKTKPGLTMHRKFHL